MFSSKKTYFTTVLVFISINIFAQSLSSKLLNLKTDAYKNSPKLKIIEEKYNQSSYTILNNLTALLPNANFNLKRQKNFYETNSALLQSLNLNTPKYVWSLDYQWSLFNYSYLNSLKRAKKENSLNKTNLEIAKKEFDIEFNTSILNYLLSLYKIATIENSINKAETSKKEAKLGFELGQKTKIDVLRSDANYISLTSKKITYQDEVQSNLSKFIENTGLNKNDIEFLKNLKEEELYKLIDELSFIQNLNINGQNSESILKTKIKHEISMNQIDAEKLTSQDWPELKIQGTYDNSGNSLENSFYHPSRGHTIALILTLPIFNSGRSFFSNFEEFHLKKQIQYNLENKLLEIDHTLENNLIKINALKSQVNSLEINLNQFNELYRLTEKSYALGKSSLFELLDIQDKLIEAKINLAQSKIQLYQVIETNKWQEGI